MKTTTTKPLRENEALAYFVTDENDNESNLDSDADHCVKY